MDYQDRQEITPQERLKRFSISIEATTEFDKFVILTAREGIPAFLNTLSPDLPEDEKGRELASWTEVNAIRVLENREKAGLKNEIEDLFTRFARASLRKHIPQDEVRDDFLSGVLAGFMRKHLISPEDVIELLNQRELLGESHN